MTEDKFYVAEGEQEYRANPEDVMNILGIDAANSIKPLNTPDHNKSTPFQNKDIFTTGPTDLDKTAMKDILLRLNEEVEYTAETIVKENKSFSKNLTESEFTNEWSIRLDESNDNKYKVINVLASKVFFEDIALHESAKKICKYLDFGHPVNSETIQKILYYDKIYASNLYECKNYKRLYKTAKLNEERSKANILVDKFDASKQKALRAKKEISIL